MAGYLRKRIECASPSREARFVPLAGCLSGESRAEDRAADNYGWILCIPRHAAIGGGE